MRIVVAPDKFKGSLPAAEVARAVAAGLRARRPDLDVLELPVADGGDGTVAAAVSAGFEQVTVTAEGPTGESVTAAFGQHDGTAVLELAGVAGLERLPGGQLAPLASSTYGLGQLIAAALDRGAQTIILGIGGSASTDGGAGMLQALGLRLLDADGQPVGRGGGALLAAAAVDARGLDPRLAASRVLVASDVDNPLLGPAGAAHVFGQQKGASPAQIALLDRALAHWAQLSRAATGQDVAAAAGAGAAGGTGYAALAYLGASIRPGIALMLEIAGFDSAVAGADLVITGEGSLDTQTLRGKAPLGVARAAARHGVPVLAVAGRSSLSERQLADAGIRAAYPLTSIEPDPAACVRDAARLLERIGRQIAGELASWPGTPRHSPGHAEGRPTRKDGAPDA